MNDDLEMIVSDDLYPNEQENARSVNNSYRSVLLLHTPEKIFDFPRTTSDEYSTLPKFYDARI